MPRIATMLPVSSMPRSVDYYQQLGFTVERRQDQWHWALLRWGDQPNAPRLMLDESINAAPNAPRQHVVYLYPDDVAAYHRQLRDRGLDLPELEETFYGVTEFRIHDPDGNPLWIGQPTET